MVATPRSKQIVTPKTREALGGQGISLLFACIVGLVAPGQVFAQTQPVGGFDRLSPAPAGDAFFSVPSAGVEGELRPSVAFAFSYASEPLDLRSEDPNAPRLAWVSHQAVMHALVGLELGRRLKLDLAVPFTLTQGGESGTIGGFSAVAPEGGGVNDLRFGGRLVFVRQKGLWPAVSASLSAWAPIGDERSFRGSGTFRFAPALVVGAHTRRFAWSASFGRLFIPISSEDRLIGSQIQLGMAAGVRFKSFQIGPELLLSFASGDRVARYASTSPSGEALISARYSWRGFRFGLGGGPGLGAAPFTPAYRLLASVGYVMDFGDRRRDRGVGEGDRPFSGAGAGGLAKASPKPPLPDRDGDTVPDELDACPSIVGEASPTAKKRGCPPDRDDDGIYDRDDRCPDEPGVLSADPAKNGCPTDRDGDGIPDAHDACPDEKGKPSEDPKTNGCPAAVRVEAGQIVILQQVHFKTGGDEIQQDSFDLLGQVASLMNDHPEIARVAVDGHTDNVGVEKSNLDLSRRRALSVLKWLVDHGVDARRLEARGFGPRRPIADNKTDEGRAKNRRVEFLIRKRTSEGKAGWIDGPIE